IVAGARRDGLEGFGVRIAAAEVHPVEDARGLLGEVLQAPPEVFDVNYVVGPGDQSLGQLEDHLGGGGGEVSECDVEREPLGVVLVPGDVLGGQAADDRNPGERV